MASLPQEDLLAALLSQQPPRKQKHGCFWHLGNIIGWTILLGVFAMMVFTFLPDVLVGYGVVSADKMAEVLHLATPQAPSGGNTVIPPVAPPQPQPIIQHVAPLPDCASVQDTRTACQGAVSPMGEDSTVVETPTPAPTPTAEGFWTAEEQAQFAATQTAFYYDIPTPPPTFEAVVREGCNDPEKRAQSPLLNSWCQPLEE